MQLSNYEQQPSSPLTHSHPNTEEPEPPRENADRPSVPNSQPPKPGEGLAAIFKNSNFLALWGGQVFSQLADKVYLVLTIAIVASNFQRSDQTISGWVSAIMITFSIPAILFGSIAGVFVDRWRKKEVLVLTNIFRGLLVLALPGLLWSSTGATAILGLPLGFCILLAITFSVSTLTQFFAPAEQSTIPLIVERHYLLSANSIYTATMMASAIVGFAIGEPILAIADRVVEQITGKMELGKELVVGGFYCFAGLLLLYLRTREAPAIEREHPHVCQDIREGLSYVGNHHRVRNAMLQLVILFSVFAALAVLAVRMAEIMPQLKADRFGFLLAIGCVGLGAGAYIIGHFGQQIGSNAQLSLIGSAGMALSLIVLSASTQQLWAAGIAIAFLGGFAAMVGVPMQTTIQAQTPEEMRGKVFGLQNNAINIALSLPLALAGIAETFLGLTVVLLGLAAVVFAGGLSTWYITRTAVH